MTCHELHDRLRAGDALGPAEAEHLAGCAPCRALAAEEARVARELGGDEPLPDVTELFAGVSAAVARERGARAWLRALPTPVRRTAAVALAALLGAVVFVVTRRVDMAVYPLPRMLLALALLALVLLAVILRALHPLQRAFGSRALDPMLVGIGALSALLLAVLPPAHEAHTASLAGTGDDLWPRAAACFAFGTVFGLPLAAALLSLDRGGAHDAALLALLGAALLGNLALQLHCPVVLAPHLLLGHAAIVPVFLLAAWVFQRARDPGGAGRI